MLEPEFSIRDLFPPVGYDQWRTLAEKSLHDGSFEEKLVTHTYEGIDLKPIYTKDDCPNKDTALGFPGQLPFVRGSQPFGAFLTDWDLRQEHSLPLPAIANEAISDDVRGGVTSLLLVLDRAVQSGYDPDDPRAADLTGHKGLMAYHVDDLDAALAGVDLSKIGVALETGSSYLPVSALLIALWQRRQLAPQDIRGAFNADPIGVLAREGQWPFSIESALNQLSKLASWTAENCPQVSAVGVNTSPYHDAGASAAQDLAFAVATAVEYLRAMTDRGMNCNSAARQIQFHFSLDTHYFLSIAKLRAARRLWARVVEACGGSTDSALMKIHARLGIRVLTRADQQMNLLRNTVSVFAAALGGADAITSVPFDYAIRPSDACSRRVARNTALILQEEAHLHRVIDPMGGSWYLDNLTDQLADKAWQILQEVERLGGMLKALQSGWVAEQVQQTRTARTRNIAAGEEHIIGVTEFPNSDEVNAAPFNTDWKTLRKEAAARLTRVRSTNISIPSFTSTTELTANTVEAASQGASLGQLATALGFHDESTESTPLVAHSDAEGFERVGSIEEGAVRP